MLQAKEIIERREKPTIELPSFGLKDFQPDESTEQSHAIQNSIFKIKKIISHENVKLLSTLSEAVWHPELHLAEVTHKTGSHWSYMGHKIEQKLYIYPEEALYLLETGSIQITYNAVPLSIQRAYFVLLDPKNNISIDKYRVYSLLNNYGYKVLRHSPQNSVTKYEKQLDVHKLSLKLKKNCPTVKRDKRQQESNEQYSESSKKLKVDDMQTFPIDYKTNDTFEILKRIPKIQSYHDNSETDINFDYDLYSETEKHSFKKSCLQLPSFRVIVHRSEDPVPDLKDLSRLSSKYEDEVPVIHAIVFFDCVTFYKINPVISPDAYDTDFCTE